MYRMAEKKKESGQQKHRAAHKMPSHLTEIWAVRHPKHQSQRKQSDDLKPEASSQNFRDWNVMRRKFCHRVHHGGYDAEAHHKQNTK